MFDYHHPPSPARDADATARAALLIEQMLDELERPAHDWELIRQRALRLARVAATVAGPPTRSRRPR